MLFELTWGLRHVIFQQILFVPRALLGSESRYSATRRELLGIVFALVKFNQYLQEQKFILMTDHKALSYFHSQTDLNPLLWG